MASQTTQLIVELLDRVSGPARGVANSLRGITRTVRDATGGPITMADRLDAAITRNNRAIDAARGRMLDAVGTLYVLKTALTAPVQSAQELERALAELGAKGNSHRGRLKAIGDAAKATSSRSTSSPPTSSGRRTSSSAWASTSTAPPGPCRRSARPRPPPAPASRTCRRRASPPCRTSAWAEDLASSFDIMAAAGKAGGFELKDMAQYLPSITALASSKGMTGQQGLGQIAAALQIVRRGAGDTCRGRDQLQQHPAEDQFQRCHQELQEEGHRHPEGPEGRSGQGGRSARGRAPRHQQGDRRRHVPARRTVLRRPGPEGPAAAPHRARRLHPAPRRGGEGRRRRQMPTSLG